MLAAVGRALDPLGMALRDDEPGAERVATVLDGSDWRCLACFMTRMEVLYRVWKDEGEAAGRLAHEQLLALPLQWVECSDPLLELAASLKARHPLSLADAWIAAAAVIAFSAIGYLALERPARRWIRSTF